MSTLSRLYDRQRKGFTYTVIADKQFQIKRNRSIRIVQQGEPVSFHKNEFRARESVHVKSGIARYFPMQYIIDVYNENETF